MTSLILMVLISAGLAVQAGCSVSYDQGFEERSKSQPVRQPSADGTATRPADSQAPQTMDPTPAPASGVPAPAADTGPIIIPPTVTATTRLGPAADDLAPSRGRGGLILMGGGPDVDSAFVWAHEQIAGDRVTRRGDVIVLRATGADGYDTYLAQLAPFHSVQTLIIGPNASRQDLDTVARLVRRAELVFFAGGNQADYVAWRQSDLMPAVQSVYTKGGVVGGTSAGLAILGQFVFDAISAGAANVTTAEAVANPFATSISFTRNMLNFPTMRRVITDTHFAERDRFGRLASFVARQFTDGAVTATERVTGIGVSEDTAVLVDAAGRAIRAPGSVGSAYVIRGTPATRAAAAMSLGYPNLSVIRLEADGQFYDFTRSCGTGPSYSVNVDGSLNGLYSPTNLYTVAGPAGTCPP